MELNKEVLDEMYAQEKILLWPEGRMPVQPDSPTDPDYIPFMIPRLLPDGVQPQGAVIIVPGGDQNEMSTVKAFQVAKDFNALGYQAFVMKNRVNILFSTDDNSLESGVDVARGVRIVRADAEKYRIDPANVAVCGLSNGGLTCENCIEYYSGEQKVADRLPGYEPDELDEISATPDAFLCVYGPRYYEKDFDYTNVVYPPVFYAIGREDAKAFKNVNRVYPIQMEHGVPVEIHTFAGVPHGQAGNAATDQPIYPGFELWMPLADYFMRDVYGRPVTE